LLYEKAAMGRWTGTYIFNTRLYIFW
jgi:hypothetical protein